MRMLAAASTIPVTKAAKQKNSKSSLRIVVMYPCASAPIGWGRLGPRPGRVCLVLLTAVDEGRGVPDLAAMHEARRPQRRCKRSGFAPAARRCGSGSSRPLAACGGAPSSRACAAPRLDAATSQSRRTSRSIARPNRRDCPAPSSRADCPTGPTCVDACHAGRPQAAI